MEKILASTKDFKIIPENFKSSGELKILNINEDTIEAKLILDSTQSLSDYSQGANIEVFGVNDLGLIYFETKILAIDGDTISIKTVPDYSIIQRREYSRVVLDKGYIKFKDLSQDIVEKMEDISAGGLKFISKQYLEPEKQYKIEFSLSNNMHINCSFQPIRVEKTSDEHYIISGKFVDLENLDRVVLVQYAFKIKMEEQNKE